LNLSATGTRIGLSMWNVQKQWKMVTALLDEQSTLSLATTGPDGEACVAPLFYIVDEGLTLCWLSSENSAHSINLTRTPRAAAAVYRDTADWKRICGVQMRGTTSRIEDPVRAIQAGKRSSSRHPPQRVVRLSAGASALHRQCETLWLQVRTQARG
jgi:uncharacterized protein YhbP (UPF0306 family)